MFEERMNRARTAMVSAGLDAVLLSVGADLPYFTGYEAMPLERLTMLVLPRNGAATLVVPELEAPRVVERPDVFMVRPWTETQDPIAIVTELLGGANRAAIGDTTWSRFTVDLLAANPGLTLTRASAITSPIRAVKTADEINRLRMAAEAVDRIAARLQAGEIQLVGQTEAAVSAELGRQIIAEGHHRVNFAIVAAGANAASPHHEPGDRLIAEDEVVLCDFGGTWIGDDGIGYCSDITRCVWTGAANSEFSELYDVLFAAQAAQVKVAKAGVVAQDVDRVGRAMIADAGYGDYFVHRTGHGIGVEAHEDPYIVEGNTQPLVVGNAFSIEPGIYIPGKWGARLEDIVVAGADNSDPLNRVDHHLAVLG
jgi:Xaa-Pro aminopeptidase